MIERSYLITDVTPHPPAVYVKILTEEGETVKLRFTEKAWDSRDLNKGDEITEEVYSDIRLESEKCEAVTKAMYCISASSISIKGLEGKLSMAGFSEESVRYAVDAVVKRGLIDEYEQAARIAENEAVKKRRGPMRIRQELMAKGYSSSIAEAAAESVSDEVYTEALTKELDKRCPYGIPEEKADRQKLVASLMRQGFSSGAVFRLFDFKNKT